MKQVVVISDATGGGAGIACGRLCDALRQQAGLDVEWLALRGDAGGRARIAETWPPAAALIWRRIRSRFARNESALRDIEARFNEAALARLLRRTTPDVINLHGLHEGMSFGLLDRLPAHIPLVWTLHDMWPITGYCYYSMDCAKYLDGCRGDCPQMGKCGAAIRPPAVEWTRRDRALTARSGRIALVAPSRWLAECADRRFQGRVRTRVIPNGINTDVFCPAEDRDAVRRALGLPPGAAIVLSGAVSIRDERKGGRFLADAVRRLQGTLSTPLRLVLFGADAGPGGGLPAGTLCTGTIRDEALLRLYYSVADVFVSTSLADNLPNTIMESIACGTPVVAFDAGGCRDMVRDGQSGFLAPAGDAGALADGMARVLLAGEAERAALRAACRRIAVAEYSVTLQAQRYLSLCGELAEPRQGIGNA